MSKNKQVLRRCLKCCAGDDVDQCITCGRLFAFKHKLKDMVEAMPDHIRYSSKGQTIKLIIEALGEVEKIELEER